MRIILTVCRDGKEIERFSLKAPNEATFGRVAGNGIADKQYHDDTLSRHHFRIEPQGSEWILRDLNSRNGTKVDGKKISSLVLRTGTVIAAGKLTFEVEVSGTSNHSMTTNPLTVTDPDGAFEVAVKAKRGELNMKCACETADSGQIFFTGDFGKLKSAAELVLSLKQKKPLRNVWLVIDLNRTMAPLPDSLKAKSVPIIDWISPHYAEEVSPRLIELKDLPFPEWEPVVSGAWGTDGLYMIFSEQSQDELLTALRKSCRQGSAISGVLWPSVLSYMLLKSKSDSASHLLSSCSAILMEFADFPEQWQLIGPPELGARLQRIGIVPSGSTSAAALQSNQD